MPDSVHQLPMAVCSDVRLLAAIHNGVLKGIRKLDIKYIKTGQLIVDMQYYWPKEYMQCDEQLQKMAYSACTSTDWRSTYRAAKLWWF